MRAGGILIAVVARGHGVNAKVVRKWLGPFRDHPPVALPAFISVRVGSKRRPETSVIIEQSLGSKPSR